MEVSAIRHLGAAGAHGRIPLLRLQSDERLVGLVRRGNHHAFAALVSRYESRLLAFCRHMLSSREDAEDVLQEVFAAAFHAMLADDRPINVRPWLYRIARNRSLNHLRRVQALGVDSMDVHFAEHGLSTADKAHRREDFRLLIADVQDLPETQRTALLLREIDALSYEQIAEAMENTVPSVKSLLVRARVGLAEAAEARMLDCDVVRFELGEVAEGLKRISPPVRRHVRACQQCALFRRQLADTNRQLAALLPVGPLLILKKTLLAQIGSAAAASGGPAAATGSAAGGALQLTFNAAAGKAAAGLAAAAIVTAGAVEAKHVAIDREGRPTVVATASAPAPAPASVPSRLSETTPTAALTPATPTLDPFAATPAPLPAATGEDADAPAGDAARSPGKGAGEAGETVTAAGADGDQQGETGVVGQPTLIADVTAPGEAGAGSLGMPLATPVISVPAPSPAPIEGVVRPADSASGTPATGVVGPFTADRQSLPIVEAIAPTVAVPVADDPAAVTDPGAPATDGSEGAASPVAPAEIVEAREAGPVKAVEPPSPIRTEVPLLPRVVEVPAPAHLPELVEPVEDVVVVPDPSAGVTPVAPVAGQPDPLVAGQEAPAPVEDPAVAPPAG